MDTLVKQIPSLKAHLKDTGDFIRLGTTLGTGPNGEVEELTMRGTHCVGKKLHGFLLDPTKKDSKNILDKFATYCNQISRLNHPNVAAFFGVCIFDNVQDSSKCLVLVREYAKHDLLHLLDTNPSLPLAFKTSILLDVTKALEYLHMCKPVITHRNLTSTNVLITDSLKARVADMECACFHSLDRHREMRRMAFIAPEVSKPNSKAGTASDIFSFGQIALHTAVHKLPEDLSQGSTELEKRLTHITILKESPNMDKILVDLIEICLNDSPKKRPTASTAMRDLEQLEQKLACQGDKYHFCIKRMTMYEMAEKLVERHEDTKKVQSATNTPTDERKKSMYSRVTQIKEGLPGLLFVKEMVKEGKLIKRQQPKWMEYKFEITNGFLQYSMLNGSVLDRFPLEEVVYTTAQTKIGNEFFPFHVYFRCNKCWILGAHSEEERITWMEAIIPGSAHNQWTDPSVHQPLKRSATAPSLHPPNDPAYIKYSEINAPSVNNPPPVPKRPPSTIAETTADNPYLTILPPDAESEVDERTEAIAGFTLEQVHLMIDMFKQNVSQPTFPTPQDSKPRAHTIPRNTPVNVSEHSSKHESKGLYMSYSELSKVMEESNVDEEHSPGSSPVEGTSGSQHKTKLLLSPRKQGLCRQNAVRFSSTHNHQERKIPSPESITPEDSQKKLRCILRQQSSEDMLNAANPDTPKWSKAKLEEAEETPNVTACPQEPGVGINTLSVSTKELHELTSIAIGHFGQVYKANYITKQATVVVKAFQDPYEHTDCSQFLHDIAVMAASDHPNIVRLFGLILENKWLVMEYTSRGDLKNYLRSNRVSSTHLIKYMFDIAMGMHYISARGLVHRNLALRNILIMEDDTCKVADLGMKNRSFSVSKLDMIHDLSPHTDQRRWMSPENLTRGHFAEASDVWSYGVTQWEMFQPGRVPYSALNSSQFPAYIIKGHTLDIPDICPEIVAKIMRACWLWNTTKRPSFMYIASLLIKRTLGDAD